MSKQEIKQLLIEILIGTTSAVIFCITYHYSPNWIKDFILGIGGSGLGGVGFLIGACVSGAGFSEEEMAGFFRALLFFWGLRTVEYGPTEGVGWDTS